MGVMLSLGSAFDFEMLEILVRGVGIEDLRSDVLVEQHDGAHVQRESIGKRLLLELEYSQRTGDSQNADAERTLTEGNATRSIVEPSFGGSRWTDDLGRK